MKPASSLLNAAVIGLLGTALAGCGGKHDPAAAADGAYSYLPTTSTLAPSASSYTGFYHGQITERPLLMAIWIRPDGRIGGAILDREAGKATEMLHFAAQWPKSSATPATIDVLDAAGQPWGRLELGGHGHAFGDDIKVTVTPANSGRSYEIQAPQGIADTSLANRSSMMPQLVLASISHRSVRIKGSTRPLHISRNDSTGTIEVQGTIERDADALDVHTSLRPTEVQGVYRARTVVTVPGGSAPIELKGHAYADVGANGAAMIIEGMGGGQYIYLYLAAQPS